MENNYSLVINSIDQDIDLYSSTLHAIRENIANHENYKESNSSLYKDVQQSINFSGFITISLLDLLLTFKNIVATKGYWAKKHNQKTGYMIICSCIDAYEKHQLFISKIVSQNIEHKGSLLSIKTDLKDFKKDFNYDTKIRMLRNTTGAHIDPDFKKYYDSLMNIDDKIFIDTILAYLQIIKKIQTLSMPISYLTLNEYINHK